jgi:predicted AAA+ superfamily ATPase
MVAASAHNLIVIDEVQKIPHLLDEVHRLIEKTQNRFLLTGSSARSLKRGDANMLGGRAWEARLFPLVSNEIQEFDLDRYLRFGGLPHVYTSNDPDEELRAYASLYLREEIMAEGIVRDLPRFSRLLKVAALSNSRQVNFTKLASDVGCAPSTAIEHFRILEDTLIGFFLEPWRVTRNRKEATKAKFYFFDTGVANTLAGTETLDRNSDLYGRALEQLVAMELRAYIHYRRLKHELHYWAVSDETEVDFVLPDVLAIEVKATAKATQRDLKGLLALERVKKLPKKILISLDPTAVIDQGVHILPLHQFLTSLWNDELIT